MLGLAGAILMVTADTKEVEATSGISYKSEAVSCLSFQAAGDQWLEEADIELTRIRKEQEIEEELARQKAEQAEKKRKEEEERKAYEEEERAAQEAKEAEEQAAAQAAAEALEREETQEAAAEDGAPIENGGWIYEVSTADYQALLKIVEAEASGEDATGRMLVANVVLNRVKSGSFPDTIEGVVYQTKGGKAQFSPVATGKIERVRVSEATIEAVERALCGEDPSQGALYFVAPAYANPESLQWFRGSLTQVLVHHGHEFYR